MMFESEDCSKHTIEFCGEMKEAVALKQLLYKRKTKRYLPIQRAVEHIIKEWKELKST